MANGVTGVNRFLWRITLPIVESSRLLGDLVIDRATDLRTLAARLSKRLIQTTYETTKSHVHALLYISIDPIVLNDGGLHFARHFSPTRLSPFFANAIPPLIKTVDAEPNGATQDQSETNIFGQRTAKKRPNHSERHTHTPIDLSIKIHISKMRRDI